MSLHMIPLLVLPLLWASIGFYLLQCIKRNIFQLGLCDKIRAGLLQAPADYSMFLRHSNSALPSNFELTIRAFTIGQFRMFVSIFAHLIGYFSIFAPTFAFAHRLVSICCAVIVWSVGLECEEEGRRSPAVGCIVSNHVSTMDSMLLVSLGTPVIFLARVEAMNIPIVGQVCKHLGYLFVKRDSEESRQEVQEKISERILRWEPKDPQLIIFPEGTTTNGRGNMLSFKTGAFHALSPVQCVRITYENDFDAYTLTDDVMMMMGMLLCLPKRKVKVSWLPPLTPKINETPQEYAKRATELVAGEDMKICEISGARVHREAQLFVEKHLN